MIDGQEPENAYLTLGTLRTRNVSPERFLSKKTLFPEVKRQRKHLKSAIVSNSAVKKFTMIGLNSTK